MPEIANTGGWYGGVFDKPVPDKPEIYGDISYWTQDPKEGDVHYQGEGSGQGWFPVWKDSVKGAEKETKKAGEKISEQEASLRDPNSKYYTDYYKKLKGTLSAQTSLNSLLGLNRAMGLGMAGSATIANEQRKAVEGKITDYAGQSTKDLFQSNLGAANSLLGMGLQNAQFQQGFQFQNKQYQDAQKFDWKSLLGVAGQFGGYLLGGLGKNTTNTTIGGTDNLARGSSWMNKQYGG